MQDLSHQDLRGDCVRLMIVFCHRQRLLEQCDHILLLNAWLQVLQECLKLTQLHDAVLVLIVLMDERQNSLLLPLLEVVPLVKNLLDEGEF